MENKKEFVNYLQGIARYYKAELDPVTISIYYEALKDYKLEKIKKAFNNLILTAHFMPKVDEIINIITKKQDLPTQAEIAYDKLKRARKEIGAYKSVIFDDPIIHRIIESYGGWIKICRMTYELEQYTAFKKNFINEYIAFSKDSDNYNYPLKLTGIEESENAGRFPQEIPVAIYVGNNKQEAVKLTQKRKKRKYVEQKHSQIKELRGVDEVVKALSV